LATRSLEIPLPDSPVPSLGALLDEPAAPARPEVVLLAHGAGAPMESDFMADVAAGLAAAGHAVLRFRYPYMERAHREGRRLPPDRMPRLEQAHRAALAELQGLLPGRPLILAGKSMGGRVSSHLAAAGVDCAGLVFFGYPLHPAGKPERLRSEHFERVTAPSLFLQGSRDKLCDLALLEQELGAYGGRHQVEVIEEADHGFAVPKRTGLDAHDVRHALVEHARAWITDLD